jgi:general secretion pathway protein D
MRSVRSVLTVCLLAGLAGTTSFAANDAAVDAPIISCGNGVPGGVSCIPTKKDLKQARSAYARGVKLENRNQVDQAFVEFDEASRLATEDTRFFSAREVAKSQLVFQHTERGDAFLADGQREPAAAEFRSALKLDPDNDYLQSRLAEATLTSDSAISAGLPALLADSTEIHLQPRSERATFHYRGDIQGLFTELASAYGVSAEFDDSIKPKTVRFYVDDVDFFTALNLACLVSKTMWAPLDTHQFLVAENTLENHKQFDRMSLATFAVPGASTPQETQELVNSLKGICDFQKTSSAQNGTVEVRAPQAMLRACTTLMQQLATERPQVALEIEIYQISHDLTRNIGVHIPQTFNLYNIPVAALFALGGQSIQSLVNQLISSGGINQAGSSGLAGLLAQLQSQPNSIFSQPLATFGGGLTFSGVSLDELAVALSVNESWSRAISRATLRAGQGKEATFHVGERYPILNASYAPVFNSPAISQVLGNQSYVPPFPSVSYEDLGLNLKATTAVHGDSDVSLKLELQVRSLTGQSANGVPIISNQEYQGSIRLRDGEPAAIAGEITSNDVRSMSGIPGLAGIPGLNQALTTNTLNTENDELLIVITPHIVANRNQKTDAIWVTAN